MRRVLDTDALRREKGLDYHPATLWRWVKAGKFPKPFKLGAGGKNVWLEDEIDAWLDASRAA